MMQFEGERAAPQRVTLFACAADAWFWAMTCRDAMAEGARCSKLLAGRPCDVDDVINAMARLDLPASAARVVVEWGRRREAPPPDTGAAVLWNAAMARLDLVLVERFIVHAAKRSGLDLVDALVLAVTGDLPPPPPAA